jgi:RNA polymerase sigma factor for flagellar operon FliA
MSDVSPLDRDQLAVTHLGFVRALARRHFARRALDLSDLESAGTLGLLDAARRFDPARGVRFSTLAAHRIVGAMRDEIRDGGTFTRAELPAARAGALVRHLVPLEAATIAAVDPEVTDVIAARRLRAAVRRLPLRLAKVIVWRYWHGLSQPAIGARLGVTHGRVSHLEREALARLREAVKGMEA